MVLVNATSTPCTSQQASDVQPAKMSSTPPTRSSAKDSASSDEIFDAYSQNLLPFITKSYMDGVDLSVALDHGKKKKYARGFGVCTGFVTIKANTKTVHFVYEWERRCHDGDSRGAINDQTAFNLGATRAWHVHHRAPRPTSYRSRYSQMASNTSKSVTKINEKMLS